MLRISRRADYAVRIMIAAAQAPPGAYIAAPRIGEDMLIPQPFLAKVIGDLKHGGLVRTASGRSGGVSLARSAHTITLRHIIEAIEGPIVLNACLLRPGECPRDQVCPAHPVWSHIQRVLHAEMDAINLAQLATRGYRLRPAGVEQVPHPEHTR